MAHPAVSIVISVHNDAATLARALRSVEEQTFSNFEVVAINDASSDNTGAILDKSQKKLGPERFQILTNSRNLGLTKSLNLGILSARTDLIARLDADDWWEPAKLATQLQYLQSHPDIGLLGCAYVNHYQTHSRTVHPPLTDAAVRKYIFRRNPFAHSAVVFRKGLWERVGGYNERLRYGQDLELWFRALPHTKLANLPDALCHRSITNTLDKRQQMWNHVRTTVKYIQLYHASPLNYLYLAEPLAVMLYRSLHS